MDKASRHVVPKSKGRWAVRKSGASRATRVFETQKEAEHFAKEIAQKEHTELYIHGRDGTIRDRKDYGSDTFSPKG